MAEKKTKNPATEPEITRAPAEVTEAEKKYKVRIPRDKSIEGEDPGLFVSVNERSWLIKRGVEVEVPECVVEVLKWMEEAEDMQIQYAESVAFPAPGK